MLLVTRRKSFPHFRRKLVDRGIFLLLVGHPVLAFMGVLAGTGFYNAYRVGYITDAIAIAIIIGQWLASTLSQRSKQETAVAGRDEQVSSLWVDYNRNGVIPRQRTVGAKKRLRHNAAKPLQKQDLKRYARWRVPGMEDALRPVEMSRERRVRSSKRAPAHAALNLAGTLPP